MSRPLTPAVVDALNKRQLQAGILAFFDFEGGPLYVWSGIGDLDYDGNTYQGVGTLGSIGVIGETSRLEGRGMTYSLSGVPSALIAVALGEHYQGRRCTTDIALFDGIWQLIADPIRMFTGRLDTMQVDDTGETATISINAESRWIDLTRFNIPLYYTDQDQKKLFPGDRGLEYVEAMQERVIQWGRVSFGGATAPTSPGAPGDGPGNGGINEPAPELPEDFTPPVGSGFGP